MGENMSLRGKVFELNDANDIYMTMNIRILSDTPNKNNAHFTSDFIKGTVRDKEKYIGIPFVVDRQLIESRQYNRLTHKFVGGELKTDQIGSFVDFWYDTDENGILYLAGEVRIMKRFPKTCKAIIELYNTVGVSTSSEVMVLHSNEGENGVRVIDYGDGLNKLFASALVSSPADVDAKAQILVAEALDEDLSGDEQIAVAEEGELNSMEEETKVEDAVEESKAVEASEKEEIISEKDSDSKDKKVEEEDKKKEEKEEKSESKDDKKKEEDEKEEDKKKEEMAEDDKDKEDKEDEDKKKKTETSAGEAGVLEDDKAKSAVTVTDKKVEATVSKKGTTGEDVSKTEVKHDKDGMKIKGGSVRIVEAEEDKYTDVRAKDVEKEALKLKVDEYSEKIEALEKEVKELSEENEELSAYKEHFENAKREAKLLSLSEKYSRLLPDEVFTSEETQKAIKSLDEVALNELVVKTLEESAKEETVISEEAVEVLASNSDEEKMNDLGTGSEYDILFQPASK